jgi:tetratricopeptide (TPR) repeat protein
MISHSSAMLDGGFAMRLRYAFGLLGLLFGLAQTHAITQAQAAPSAADTEERARAHFRLGRAHYDNGNFSQAGAEFEEAYRISQRAALLYNIYLAYRDANDTHKAADALRKYLQLEKAIENRGQLESRLAALDRALASESQPAASTPAQVATPAPAATPAQPLTPAPPLSPLPEAAPPTPETKPAPEAATAQSSPRSSSFPVVPVILMGTGGAMMATSIVTGLMAVSKHSEWEDARTTCVRDNNCALVRPARVAELNALKSSGETLATVTDVLLFGGLAVAGTGVVLLLLDSGDSGESAPSSATTAGLACAPGACQASVRASF